MFRVVVAMLLVIAGGIIGALGIAGDIAWAYMPGGAMLVIGILMAALGNQPAVAMQQDDVAHGRGAESVHH